MPATGEGIRAITGSELLDAALAPFIIAADCIMADLAASGCTTGKSQTCLDQAANFLGAHFLATSKLGEDTLVNKSERFENYQETRKVGADNGTGLLSTDYGNTANALLGGCLTDLDSARAVVQFA